MKALWSVDPTDDIGILKINIDTQAIANELARTTENVIMGMAILEWGKIIERIESAYGVAVSFFIRPSEVRLYVYLQGVEIRRSVPFEEIKYAKINVIEHTLHSMAQEIIAS